MLEILNDLLTVIWLLIPVMGIIYVNFITIESYKARIYYKTMTLISIIYTAVALWLIYLIVTTMY